MAASVRIEDEAFSDERYDDLAAASGLADGDHARGKMAKLWRQCTLENRYVLPRETVLRILGERGIDALVTARLGEVVEEGVRIRGTRGRIEWLAKLRKNGKFGKRGGRPKKNPPGLPEKPSRVSDSTTNGTPPSPSPSPSPSVPDQIPDSLAPARDPAVPVAVPPQQGESAWHRRKRWWDAMLEADQRIRTSGIEPNAQKLPPAPAGEHEKNMNRCEQNLLAEGRAPAEVDAKMRHIVLVAEAEAMRPDNRSRRWFKPALIWDPARAARAADTSLEEAGSTPQRMAPARAREETPIERQLKRVAMLEAKEKQEAEEAARNAS